MNSAGDAFGWAFRDPSWFGKIVLQSLIFIIPIVGWIAGAGWVLLAFENARNGRNELPPAGFHLSRGIGLFGVIVIYVIVLGLPGYILSGAGAHGIVQQCVGSDNTNCTYNYVGGPLSGLGSLWNFLAQLFLDFLLPTLIVTVFHSGFGGAFDLGRVWSYATRNPSNSLIAGLIVFVAGFISGLGIIVCCVGILFTIGYAFTIHAGIAAWFERVQSAPAAPPTLPSAPPPAPG